jgi:hypothetical protein
VTLPPVGGPSRRPVPHDAPVAPARRQGDPAQAAEQDLLPDLRRRPRGRAHRRRHGCKPSYDWFYLYYRDRALCLQLGMTPAEMLYEAVGAAIDPNSGGRQMPSTGAQGAQHRQHVLAHRHAVPAGRRVRRGVAARSEARHPDRRFGRRGRLVSTGDGTTSEGEFWESLNTAATSSCRSSTSSRTTATPSPCRSRSTPPAARSPSWCAPSPTSTSRKSTAATSRLVRGDAEGRRVRAQRKGPASCTRT